MRTALAALLFLAGPALAAEPIVGRASVTDGDTVVIRGARIRLHGIDAPESAQLCQDAGGKSYRCGQRAAFALADRIGEANISREPRDTDRYGRTVAVCRKGDEDLNAWMVGRGYATAYQRYSRDYVGAETTARALKRGLWAGTFDPPSDWRRAKRASGVETRPEVDKAPCGCSGAHTDLLRDQGQHLRARATRSTTCPGRGTTTGPSSLRAPASACSAARMRRRPRAGEHRAAESLLFFLWRLRFARPANALWLLRGHSLLRRGA